MLLKTEKPLGISEVEGWKVPPAKPSAWLSRPPPHPWSAEQASSPHPHTHLHLSRCPQGGQTPPSLLSARLTNRDQAPACSLVLPSLLGGGLPHLAGQDCLCPEGRAGHRPPIASIPGSQITLLIISVLKINFLWATYKL